MHDKEKFLKCLPLISGALYRHVQLKTNGAIAWVWCHNFLPSTGLAQRFEYLHNSFHNQFVSKHLTCCIRNCFTGM